MVCDLLPFISLECPHPSKKINTSIESVVSQNIAFAGIVFHQAVFKVTVNRLNTVFHTHFYLSFKKNASRFVH